MSQTLQNQITYAKSMSGVVTLSDGTITIENGNIQNAVTITAQNIDSNDVVANQMNIQNIITPNLDLEGPLTLEQYDSIAGPNGSVSLWEKGKASFSNTVYFNGDVNCTNLPTSTQTPSLSTQLITKSYADSTYAGLSSNNAFTGLNTFNTNLPTSTLTPTTSSQLITKAYADATYQQYAGYQVYNVILTATNTTLTSGIYGSFVNITYGSGTPTTLTLPTIPTTFNPTFYVINNTQYDLTLQTVGGTLFGAYGGSTTYVIPANATIYVAVIVQSGATRWGIEDRLIGQMFNLGNNQAAATIQNMLRNSILFITTGSSAGTITLPYYTQVGRFQCTIVNMTAYNLTLANTSPVTFTGGSTSATLLLRPYQSITLYYLLLPGGTPYYYVPAISVDLISNQIITGTKTFSTNPVFNNNAIANTALQSNVTLNDTASSFTGTKTFITNPVFNNNGISQASVNGLQTIANNVSQISYDGTTLITTISNLVNCTGGINTTNLNASGLTTVTDIVATGDIDANNIHLTGGLSVLYDSTLKYLYCQYFNPTNEVAGFGTPTSSLICIGNNAFSIRSDLNSNNIGIGYNAFAVATNPTANCVGIGSNVYAISQSISNITAIGHNCGTLYLQSGSNNTLLGANTDFVGAGGYSNSTAIGYGAIITGDNQVVLGRSTETVRILGNLNVSGTITFGSSSTTIGGTLAVTGASTIGGTLGVTGATTMSSATISSTLTVTGNATFNALGVTGATTMSSATISSTLTVTGNATFNALASIGNQYVNNANYYTGNFTISSPISAVYCLAPTVAQVITLPAASASNVGCTIIFRRVGGTTTVGVTTSISVYNGSNTLVTTILGSGQYTVKLTSCYTAPPITGTFGWFMT